MSVKYGGLGAAGFEASSSATAPTDPRQRDGEPYASPPARRAGLVLLHPRPVDAVPAVFRVSGAGWVGRSRHATIHLEDARVSRRHARLEPRQDGVFVRDEGSRHGTFINAVPVTSAGAVACFGDVVRVGNALLLVVANVERAAARPRRSEGSSLGLTDTLVAGPELAEVWDETRRAANLREPVLVLGESGSGKEGIVRMLHVERVKPGPFVALNVSALPSSLFEAELFGHERGAFTGAGMARPGAFREAGDGLLFLDEIGELKLENQAKLLRALDRGQVRPLGGKGDVAVHARVVSATSRDLEQACNAGDFRADLYYRLSGLVIRVPPLRERRGDILLIAHEVLKDHSRRLALSTDAAEQLAIARWDGNARQLRHALSQAAHRASASQTELILTEHLSLSSLPRVDSDSDKLTLERVERAFAQSSGVASHAARRLGVSRTTLYKALKRLRGEKPDHLMSAPGALEPETAVES